MFQFQLVLRRKSETKLILGISFFFRALLLSIAGIIALAIVVNQIYSATALIIIFITLLAACYQDLWIFDKKEGWIEKRSGLLFLNKKSSYEFDDITEVFIRRIEKGKLKNSNTKSNAQAGQKSGRRIFQPVYFLELNLKFKSGEIENLEINKARNPAEFEKKAGDLADFLNKPLNVL